MARHFSTESIVGFVGRTPWNPSSYPFPHVRNSDALESNRLDTFEIVKFYSTFVNKEERANDLWNQAVTEVDCIEANLVSSEEKDEEATISQRITV